MEKQNDSANRLHKMRKYSKEIEMQMVFKYVTQRCILNSVMNVLKMHFQIGFEMICALIHVFFKCFCQLF